jgi:hypothetical protein
MPGPRQLADFRFWLIGTWVCWMTPGCAGQPTRIDLTEAERREDLAYLADVFARREQSFTAQSRAAFESRLAAVQSEVGSMSHDAFIAGNLDPDVTVPLTFADYAAGRDPIMANVPSLLTASP